jgi:hypothetical protein
MIEDPAAAGSPATGRICGSIFGVRGAGAPAGRCWPLVTPAKRRGAALKKRPRRHLVQSARRLAE